MIYKHFSLLLIAGITCITVFAQPGIKSQRVTGADGNGWFTSMDLTNDGGLILGGYSYSDSSDEKTANPIGKNDYWIVKLDSANRVQWDKTIGGSKYDFLYAVQQTTDGGYI